MEYQITKQYTVEIPIREVAEVLKGAGLLPADMKPNRCIASDSELLARTEGNGKDRRLLISWTETEKVGKPVRRKKAR